MPESETENEETTDKVATLGNHVSREPDDLDELVEAIESAGYVVEGPKSNDQGLVKGSEHNMWYWTIREGDEE